MNAKTILVVEDEPSISKLCGRVLENEGFEVDIAVNGKVAQDMIQNMPEDKPYELCLIDMRTPEMNGVELYQWIQIENPGLASRVILTTGSVMQEDIFGFIERTGCPYLPKPFTPAELRTIVREASQKAE